MSCWASASESSLLSVFKCFVCAGQVQDAHLCPHCSRLFCHDCIAKWLSEQCRQCPHCNNVLEFEELVACRWVADVTQHLDLIQANQNAANLNDDNSRDRCTIHSQKLSVYCWTCQSCICHECALWGGTHTGHTFKPISEVYAQEVARIRRETNRIRRRLIKLVTTAQQVERAAVSIRRAKEDRLREMRELIEKAAAAMERQLTPKMMTLRGQQKCLTNESSQLERLLAQIDHQLQTCTQSELISKSGELSNMICAVKRYQSYHYAMSSINLYQTQLETSS